ncbi:MAG: hypothetical protein GXP55_21190 [Deltaproteobacteria bacterium]|nr:hypothetical protein [Deltaproteobacteria bacterium]
MRRVLIFAILLALSGCGPAESTAPAEAVSLESAPAAAGDTPATPDTADTPAAPAPGGGVVAHPGPTRPAEMEGGGYKLRLQVGTPRPHPPTPPAPTAPTP